MTKSSVDSGTSGLTSILTVAVAEEVDVVVARQRARQIALLAGFSNQDQVRIATAVSEIVRNAYQFGGGRIEFALASGARRQALWISVVDSGPGIADVDAVLSGRYRSGTGMGIGIAGSRRLMDTFEIESIPGRGTSVTFTKALPPEARRIEPSDVAGLRARLIHERPPATDEAQLRNRDLLESLESLRLRELEIERRRSELSRLSSELEETNRGVVALYAELDEKAAALRRADQLKGHFLRHVSHEFRTPLNSVLALTHMLLRRTDGELTSEQERQIGYIRQAVQDLNAMVNDLLDLAKVEAGKTEVSISRIHLGQLFGALRGIMRPLVTSDSVMLVFEDPPNDLYFDSDEPKVAQILRNLVSNALKFTERGEVRISSKVLGSRLTISVADTGIGIAPEHQERIFEEFTQIDNAVQGRVKGTGLGLHLSRKLVTLLGGELTVTSQMGEGAKFTLTLPCHIPHAPAAGSGPGCILIIDDEEAARYIARQRFRGTRHRLIEASGGVEGAERARFEKPLLILLDLIMPDRSGFDVLDDLKVDPATRDIPVMIHTSRTLGEHDYERLASRHAAILPKGDLWRPETLEYIKRLLGEPNLFSDESVPGSSAG